MQLEAAGGAVVRVGELRLGRSASWEEQGEWKRARQIWTRREGGIGRLGFQGKESGSRGFLSTRRRQRAGPAGLLPCSDVPEEQDERPGGGGPLG